MLFYNCRLENKTLKEPIPFHINMYIKTEKKVRIFMTLELFKLAFPEGNYTFTRSVGQKPISHLLNMHATCLGNKNRKLLG